MFYAKESGSLLRREKAARKEAPPREMAVLALPFIKVTTCVVYRAPASAKRSSYYKKF